MKVVTGALLGLDAETVLVGGKRYLIQPPTIKKIVGVGHYLSGVIDGDGLQGILFTMEKFGDVCTALSFLIAGDESLKDELMEGTTDEVTNAIGKGLELIKLENFIKLSALTKNVAMLIARPKSRGTLAYSGK